jgi:hypothetical protein
MADKEFEKFELIMPDGTRKELEVPLSKIDHNHPLLQDFQVQLLRLRPGDELKLPHGHFDQLSDDAFGLTTIIAAVAMQSGCNAKFDELISTNPDVRGYVFTRRDDLPLLDALEPEGGAH